jgi:methyl-accepting chemotaxis protein
MKEKISKTQKLVDELVKNESLLRMDAKSASDYLKEQQSKAGFVEFMAILNRDGYVTASTIEIPEAFKDSSAKLYYQKACQGESMVSEEYISVASNNYNISVTVPFDLDGKFAGLIIADININEN